MIKTIAGLVPEENEVLYKITTEQAEDFIQTKIDFVVQAMNRNGFSTPDIKVMMFTSKCSKKFLPMMLLMPTSVLKSKKESKNNDELEMFNPGNGDRAAKMKDPIYELIKCYLYDKKDENVFFTNSWRQALGVSMKTSHMLKANRTPKVQKFNKGQNEYVVCLIDPVRLFHDMLTDHENPGQRFTVEIGDTNQIKSGNYKYDVYRAISKKKKQETSDEERIAFEVNQRLNG